MGESTRQSTRATRRVRLTKTLVEVYDIDEATVAQYFGGSVPDAQIARAVEGYVWDGDGDAIENITGRETRRRDEDHAQVEAEVQPLCEKHPDEVAEPWYSLDGELGCWKCLAERREDREARSDG